MASRRASIKKNAKKSLLPASVSNFLHKSFIRLWGSALILLFAALALSFATYNINDPSLNNVVEGDATNLLGLTGSHVADVFMQALGLASYILVLPLLTWGWRVISLQGLPFIFMHLLMLPFLGLSAALTLATIPPYETWALTGVGLGGMLGQFLLSHVASFVAWTGISFYALIIGVIFSIISAFCFFYTAGLDRIEWGNMGRGINWLTIMVLSKIVAGILFLRKSFQGAAAKPKTNISKSKTTARNDPPLKTAEGKEKRTIPIIGQESKSKKASKRETIERQPMLDIITDGEFALPSLSLLAAPQPLSDQDRLTNDALEQNARMLESVLDDFGV
ncbi:MAG: DNA translocase FtsK 4TM domain-containing protein, partial [Emcibacteraceae bacterium]|nr:DNA translocase FtsK 4TM domain-containing protein [Emcibacteraceae bacterium]